jgi:hypothetical protein
VERREKRGQGRVMGDREGCLKGDGRKLCNSEGKERIEN